MAILVTRAGLIIHGTTDKDLTNNIVTFYPADSDFPTITCCPTDQDHKIFEDGTSLFTVNDWIMATKKKKK